MKVLVLVVVATVIRQATMMMMLTLIAFGGVGVGAVVLAWIRRADENNNDLALVSRRWWEEGCFYVVRETVWLQSESRDDDQWSQMREWKWTNKNAGEFVAAGAAAAPLQQLAWPRERQCFGGTALCVLCCQQSSLVLVLVCFLSRQLAQEPTTELPTRFRESSSTSSVHFFGQHTAFSSGEVCVVIFCATGPLFKTLRKSRRKAI